MSPCFLLTHVRMPRIGRYVYLPLSLPYFHVSVGDGNPLVSDLYMNSRSIICRSIGGIPASTITAPIDTVRYVDITHLFFAAEVVVQQFIYSALSVQDL